jgi:arylsulfatase
METFAAFAEHADAQVERFVDELEALNVLDNTVFIYILGDNGASAEGGLDGSVAEFRLTEGIVDDLDEQLRLLDRIGDPETYPIAPAGWAHAMNTPHPWSKQIASHLGGVRDGMIVHWPGGIRQQGEVRTQFHHVIDIVPTVLECVGVPAPANFQGVNQQPIEGVSMRYSFDDEHHPDARTTQYFEMLGNRGIYHEGWLASARHGIPWKMVATDERPFADDVWELYNLEEDWSQANDLAASMPEKLRELQELFTIEAAKHGVFPLDDRISERTVPELAGRPDVTGERTPVVYHGGVRRLGENVAPNVKNRSHRIEADVTVSSGSGTGVIVAQGGRFGGWSLYLKEGVPTYAYNFFGIDMTYAVASERLTEGRHRITADFQYVGGGVGQAARVVLRVNGAAVAEAAIERTVSFLFSYDETFDVGVDLASPVSPDYPAGANAFPGTVHGVTIHREQAAGLEQEGEFESLLKVQ